MKTAISIPDQLFESAERFAKQMGLSRSELYAMALKEYLQTHRCDSITEKLDAVYSDEGSVLDPLLVQMQAHTLSASSFEETW
jgi:metal-responsive CopG/Arc/MetJ family transcriptional regulator